MNYHLIKTDDMLNGSGLRVVLYLSGCSHMCRNCHNPETWDCNSGKEFDDEAKAKIFEQLNKDYISGITFSGGDPLHDNNLNDVWCLIREIRDTFPTKNIWLYTGYELEEMGFCKAINDFAKGDRDWKEALNAECNNFIRQMIISQCDVIVEGKYVEELADVNYPWAGSTNQRVIDMKKSLEEDKIVLWLG